MIYLYDYLKDIRAKGRFAFDYGELKHLLRKQVPQERHSINRWLQPPDRRYSLPTTQYSVLNTKYSIPNKNEYKNNTLSA
jgi:hypothetical protein